MWFIEHLPEALHQRGPRGLLWWQWLALPIVLGAAWLVGLLLARLTRGLLGLVVRRTSVAWDDKLLGRIGGPVALIWTAGAARLGYPLLQLPDAAESLIFKGLRTALFVAFFWLLGRVVTVIGEVMSVSSWAFARPASRSLIPLGTRIAQVAVVGMAVVAVLADLGYPVASLVAGLGIGGLAVALAGQKTIENLFGAFSIGVDQPFRVGDFVKVEDVLGTVEDIGLRSTRIRTLDRTLVSLPNGKLAEMRLESFAARDRIRLAVVLNLVFGTTAAQLREVVAGCDRVLRGHPKIWPDDVVVAFSAIGASSLDVEVVAWFTTSDFGEFRRIRQEVLFQLLEVVEKAGTSFAFPTRTIHMHDAAQGAPGAEPPRGRTL